MYVQYLADLITAYFSVALHRHNVENSNVSAVACLQTEYHQAKGELPIDFLLVEYQLFRKDLRPLLGKEHADACASRAAQAARWAGGMYDS